MRLWGDLMRAEVMLDNGDLVPICPICWDASRMNREGECNECLDDIHALEIARRGRA